jgi:secretion/DNA translocation related CpaE-like protein
MRERSGPDRRRTAERPPGARPLIATGDPTLLDWLLRLSAAAGIEPEVAYDATGARRAWAQAPLVVVGGDLAAAVAATSPPRRPGVLLVAADPDDEAIFRWAVDVGAEKVGSMPAAEAWLVDDMADAAERRTGQGASDGVTLCVVGGRGGAGASTLAAALALTATRRGLHTMLVDADPLGGGLDLVVGGENVAGIRWPELSSARGRLRSATLREVLPRVDDLTVLSCDRGEPLTLDATAVRSVLAAGARAHDLVVVDLPRRIDPPAEEGLARCAAVVLLVPAEVRAASSASRVAAELESLGARVELVVRGPAPSGLPAEAVADSLGLALLAEMRAQPGLAEALERGEPPGRSGRGPLARLCRTVLDVLVQTAVAA